MAFHSFIKLFCFSSLIFCTFVTNVRSDCYENTVNYTIRSSTGDWVLGVSDSEQVTLQRYTGASSQIFTVQCTNRPGLFYLIHQATGYRLDFKSDANDRKYVVINFPEETTAQQWFLKSRGRIINADWTGAIDVAGQRIEEGSKIIIEYLTSPVFQNWDLVEA